MGVTAFPSQDAGGIGLRATLAQFLAQVCVIALICVSITAPAITLSETLPYIRIEQALLPIIFLIYLWLMMTGSASPIRLNGMFVVAALFSCSILFSLWYGSAFLHHSVIVRDYYEIPKVWLPVVFFTLAYEAALSEGSLRRLLVFFALTMLLVCLYAWAQFAKLGISYRLNPYYSGGLHIDRALEYGGRVYSTMSNPNVLGQLITWALVAFILAFLSRIGSRVLFLGVAFACVVTLVLTGSRFGLITFAVGVILIFASIFSTNRRGAAQIGILLVLLPMFVWTIQAISRIDQPALNRIESLQHPLEVDSLRARVDDIWRDAASDFFRSPLVGNGPAKTADPGIVTDSEYLDVLKQYGVIGFLFYIAYYLYPLAVMFRGLRSVNRAGPSLEDRIPATVLVLRLGIIVTVVALLMNTALTTFYNLLLQSFLWLWMGLACHSAKVMTESGSISQVSNLEALRISGILSRTDPAHRHGKRISGASFLHSQHS
jgi:hypothetical protein